LPYALLCRPEAATSKLPISESSIFAIKLTAKKKAKEMNEEKNKNKSTLEALEIKAFKLASEQKWLFALDKLEEAIKLDKHWYHFFYKAIWLYGSGKQPEATQVIMYGLNFDKAKEFYFRYLGADILYRIAWTQAHNIEEIDQSITKMGQAILDLNHAEYLLLKNKKDIESSRQIIPKELKALCSTFLNTEDLTYAVQGLRTRIENMRQTIIMFQTIIKTENRINASIEANRFRIDSERVRTIELLGIFTAIFAFIFSGVHIFTNLPLSEAVILQGGMALIMILFLLGVYLVTNSKARTKLLIGVFVVLLVILFLLPLYATLVQGSKETQDITTSSSHPQIATQKVK
jgi:hypothetical protein